MTTILNPADAGDIGTFLYYMLGLIYYFLIGVKSPVMYLLLSVIPSSAIGLIVNSSFDTPDNNVSGLANWNY